MLKKMEACIPRYIVFLVALQPVMDVLSFWVQEAGISSLPTLALRFGVLGVTLALGFCLSGKKWAYGVAVGVLLLLEAGHVWACLEAPGGYQNPLPDMVNTVRIVQMPLLVLCFITFLRRSPRAFPALQAGLALALGIILLAELLSRLTGTDPKTYSDGLGVLGWFTLPNSQSAILSALVPLTLGWQLSRPRRNLPLFWASAALGLFALYFLGTRLAYLGIYAASVGLAASLLLTGWRSNWKLAGGLLAFALLFTLLLPASTMGYHLRVNDGAQNRRQEVIDRLIEHDRERVDALLEKRQSAPLSQEEGQWLVQALTPVYREFAGDFVEMFGAEDTMEMFQYTVDIFDFSNLRGKKLLFAKMLLAQSPPSAWVFGLDYSRFTVGKNIYDVENDMHGIFYLCGGAGLGAMLLLFLYFVILIARALLRDARRYFTIEAAGFGIAFLMCLAHAYNTAGVLRRPNASFYLSVVLAGIYYLVKIREYPEKEVYSKRT